MKNYFDKTHFIAALRMSTISLSFMMSSSPKEKHNKESFCFGLY